MNPPFSEMPEMQPLTSRDNSIKNRVDQLKEILAETMLKNSVQTNREKRES